MTDFDRQTHVNGKTGQQMDRRGDRQLWCSMRLYYVFDHTVMMGLCRALDPPGRAREHVFRLV